MATCSSILPWRISWIEEPGRLQSMESQRVGHDWAHTHTHTHTHTQSVYMSMLLSQFVPPLPPLCPKVSLRPSLPLSNRKQYRGNVLPGAEGSWRSPEYDGNSLEGAGLGAAAVGMKVGICPSHPLSEQEHDRRRGEGVPHLILSSWQFSPELVLPVLFLPVNAIYFYCQIHLFKKNYY